MERSILRLNASLLKKKNLGFAGVYIFFLFLLQNIDCGYSLYDVPTLYVLRPNKKNIKIFLLKIFLLKIFNFYNLRQICLLYKLLKISLFIGLKRPCGKSSNCHINWLARAGRSTLVTKFRADVLVPLSLRC